MFSRTFVVVFSIDLQKRPILGLFSSFLNGGRRRDGARTRSRSGSKRRKVDCESSGIVIECVQREHIQSQKRTTSLFERCRCSLFPHVFIGFVLSVSACISSKRLRRRAFRVTEKKKEQPKGNSFADLPFTPSSCTNPPKSLVIMGAERAVFFRSYLCCLTAVR